MQHTFPVSDAEIALALKQARTQAFAFLKKVPLHFDHDAFLGEAHLAVAVALDTWDETRGPFLPHAGAKVKRALMDEIRRQEPMGRHSFAKMKREGAGRPAKYQVPVRLEWLAEGDRERELPDPAMDVEALALLEVFCEAVLTAVNNLPPKYREVVVARFWGGLSWCSASEEGWQAATGVTWQGAMARMNYAEPLLRAALAEWQDAS